MKNIWFVALQELNSTLYTSLLNIQFLTVHCSSSIPPSSFVNLYLSNCVWDWNQQWTVMFVSPEPGLSESVWSTELHCCPETNKHISESHAAALGDVFHHTGFTRDWERLSLCNLTLLFQRLKSQKWWMHSNFASVWIMRKINTDHLLLLRMTTL